MSEMIERVARAIKSKVPQGYGMTDAEAEEYARAAIEAMREPTEEMLEAGAKGSGEDSIWVADGAWEFMIDSALSEAKP